jgi:hypothetical protein
MRWRLAPNKIAVIARDTASADVRLAILRSPKYKNEASALRGSPEAPQNEKAPARRRRRGTTRKFRSPTAKSRMRARVLFHSLFQRSKQATKMRLHMSIWTGKTERRGVFTVPRPIWECQAKFWDFESRRCNSNHSHTKVWTSFGSASEATEKAATSKVFVIRINGGALQGH